MGTRKSPNVRPLERLEQRVTELERTVRQLTKNAAGAQPTEQVPWYIATAGSFANDPVFDEIVRLGRAYRRSVDRPRKRGKRART